MELMGKSFNHSNGLVEQISRIYGVASTLHYVTLIIMIMSDSVVICAATCSRAVYMYV